MSRMSSASTASQASLMQLHSMSYAAQQSKSKLHSQSMINLHSKAEERPILLDDLTVSKSPQGVSTHAPESTSISEEYVKNIRSRGRAKERIERPDKSSRSCDVASRRPQSPSGRSLSPKEQGGGRAMAEQAKRRLHRSQSCDVPIRAVSSFDPCANERYTNNLLKGTLCAEKKREDLRSGPLDTSSPPCTARIVLGEHVVPQSVVAEWVSSLCLLKAEYEDEEREDPWIRPVVTKTPQPLYVRSHSPEGQPKFMKMALQDPGNTEAFKTSLFGPDARASCARSPSDPSCEPNWHRFARQRSTPLLLTQRLATS